MIMSLFNNVDYLWALFLFIPLLILLLLFIKRTFITFPSKDDYLNFKKAKKPIRTVVLISRAIIFLLLLIALAGFYTVKETVLPGEPELNILIDNSTSMQLFKQDIAEQVRVGLEQYQSEIPIHTFTISSGEMSLIGDDILNHLQGNDNILIISDGNANYGRSLGDIILFASNLNSTVNAISLNTYKNEASVAIQGPSRLIRDTKNFFEIKVQVTGSVDYQLEVEVDGQIFLRDSGTASKTIPFEHSFSLGNHKIVATLMADDEFDINNKFYKAVTAVEKPNVLMITKEQSPLQSLLSQLYETTLSATMPTVFGDYDVIVLDDIPSTAIDSSIEPLIAAIENGKGLLVVGGASSFDKTYRKSVISSILPVTTEGDKKEAEDDVNVIFVIDVTQSTGITKTRGIPVIEVEKSIAVGVLEDMRDDDFAGIVAFTQDAYLVYPLSRLDNKEEMKKKMAALQPVKNIYTYSYVGLEKAGQMLLKARGNKHIILVTDGADHYKQKAIETASVLESKGVKTYTVGVGKRIDTRFMTDIAEAGGTGLFFHVDETNKLTLLFGAPSDDNMSLHILNNKHFITRSLNVTGSLDGFNTLQAKSRASMLLTTGAGNSVLTTWRYGLGKVGVLSTDNGVLWGEDLYRRENPKLISRLVNWLVSAAYQEKDFSISLDDPRVFEELSVEIKSSSEPSHDDNQIMFSKIGEDRYFAAFRPNTIGFYNIVDSVIAVNYPKEYQDIGMSPDLEQLVVVSGGAMFEPDDFQGITEKVKSDSKRIAQQKIYFRWPFVIAAMAVFLIEILLRRLLEKRNLFK